jgi:indole-3-glycerol phosphate synthase
LDIGARIIGINNRDLRTFHIDMRTSERLRPLIPKNVICISESGIHTRGDIQRLAEWGYDAALVGEAIVTSADRRRKIGELLGTIS